MTFKLIKAGVAAVALLATPFAAVAADIRPPVYKGVPRSVISYYNWTGFYVGGTVGYGIGTSDWDLAPASARQHQPEGHALRRDARLQLAGRLVRLRPRRRLQLLQREGQRHLRRGASTCETSNTWLATFRGRVGYAFDRFLPYLTARRRLRRHQGDGHAGVRLSPPTSESKFGYTFGAGLEYAFLGNWTAKARISLRRPRHVRHRPSRRTVNNVSFSEHIVRAGLNYKFSGRSAEPPLSAKPGFAWTRHDVEHQKPRALRPGLLFAA